MKTRWVSVLLLSIVLLATGCNKDIFRMEVIKDCTGVYLRDENGQDRYVCNEEMLEGYTTGTKLKISYDKLEQCFGLLEPVTCETVHTHVGVIEVTEIH